MWPGVLKHMAEDDVRASKRRKNRKDEILYNWTPAKLKFSMFNFRVDEKLTRDKVQGVARCMQNQPIKLTKDIVGTSLQTMQVFQTRD